MRVRIKSTPVELEVDGLKLDTLTPGTVRDVSVSLGTWLIAQGYAYLEMRHDADTAREDRFSTNTLPQDQAHNRRGHR